MKRIEKMCPWWRWFNPFILCHLMFIESQSRCFSIETLGMRLNRKYLKNWQQNLQKEKVNAGMVTWNYGQNTLGKFFMVKMLHVACIGIKQQGWRLTVYTDSAKIIILMCMLKSVNTLRLKASNKACWVT